MDIYGVLCSTDSYLKVGLGREAFPAVVAAVVPPSLVDNLTIKNIIGT